VTVGEEIRCLLDAGWTWDGDKLVHPTHNGIWTMYKRIDSSGIAARSELFESDSGKPFVRHGRGDRGNGRRVMAGGYDAVRSSKPCPSAPDHGLSSTHSTPFRIPFRVSFEL